MEKYMENANACLEHAHKLPKFLLRGCAGLILISSKEAGFVVSGASGLGVLVSHKDGKWSPPVAVKLSGWGIGAVAGAQEREMLIVLGHMAAKKLVEGDVQYTLGASAGFAVADFGRQAEIEMAVSNKGGVGMSYVYSYAKGTMISAQIENTMIAEEPHVNVGVYHKSSAKEIIHSGVPSPDTYGIGDFMSKLEALTAGPAAGGVEAAPEAAAESSSGAGTEPAEATETAEAGETAEKGES